MKQLTCKQCGVTLRFVKPNSNPKFCERTCYWEHMKTPKTVALEKSQKRKERLQVLWDCKILVATIAALVIACVCFRCYY